MASHFVGIFICRKSIFTSVAIYSHFCPISILKHPLLHISQRNLVVNHKRYQTSIWLYFFSQVPQIPLLWKKAKKMRHIIEDETLFFPPEAAQRKGNFIFLNLLQSENSIE